MPYSKYKSALLSDSDDSDEPTPAATASRSQTRLKPSVLAGSDDDSDANSDAMVSAAVRRPLQPGPAIPENKANSFVGFKRPLHTVPQKQPARKQAATAAAAAKPAETAVVRKSNALSDRGFMILKSVLSTQRTIFERNIRDHGGVVFQHWPEAAVLGRLVELHLVAAGAAVPIAAAASELRVDEAILRLALNSRRADCLSTDGFVMVTKALAELARAPVVGWEWPLLRRPGEVWAVVDEASGIGGSSNDAAARPAGPPDSPASGAVPSAPDGPAGPAAAAVRGGSPDRDPRESPAGTHGPGTMRSSPGFVLSIGSPVAEPAVAKPAAAKPAVARPVARPVASPGSVMGKAMPLRVKERLACQVSERMV